MKKIRLENVDIHLREKLKSEKFRKLYEFESAKVALAQKIAELRQNKGLRQVELANRLGTSQQFVSQIETGEEKNLTVVTLLRVAKALGRGVNISFPRLTNKRRVCFKVT
jgi:DNA-binding XRE family transcriptional regulator